MEVKLSDFKSITDQHIGQLKRIIQNCTCDGIDCKLCIFDHRNCIRGYCEDEYVDSQMVYYCEKILNLIKDKENTNIISMTYNRINSTKFVINIKYDPTRFSSFILDTSSEDIKLIAHTDLSTPKFFTEDIILNQLLTGECKGILCKNCPLSTRNSKVKVICNHNNIVRRAQDLVVAEGNTIDPKIKLTVKEWKAKFDPEADDLQWNDFNKHWFMCINKNNKIVTDVVSYTYYGRTVGTEYFSSYELCKAYVEYVNGN